MPEEFTHEHQNVRQRNVDAPEATRRRNAIRDALGADVVIALGEETTEISPAALAATARRLATRLTSSGGRPTDPDWSITRQVPFALSTWDRLGHVAEAISTQGRRVARGQLAAILIETGLSQLDKIETSPEALDLFMQRAANNSD